MHHLESKNCLSRGLSKNYFLGGLLSAALGLLVVAGMLIRASQLLYRRDRRIISRHM